MSTRSDVIIAMPYEYYDVVNQEMNRRLKEEKLDYTNNFLDDYFCTKETDGATYYIIYIESVKWNYGYYNEQLLFDCLHSTEKVFHLSNCFEEKINMFVIEETGAVLIEENNNEEIPMICGTCGYEIDYGNCNKNKKCFLIKNIINIEDNISENYKVYKDNPFNLFTKYINNNIDWLKRKYNIINEENINHFGIITSTNIKENENCCWNFNSKDGKINIELKLEGVDYID